MFKPITPGVNLSELEEEILEIWRKEKTFEKSLNKKSPKGDWTFLDGPPFVTGIFFIEACPYIGKPFKLHPFIHPSAHPLFPLSFQPNSLQPNSL